MAQINLSDPRFGIKIISAEEAIKKIPRDALIVKCVDLHRTMTGKEPLLKREGGWTEAGAKMTMEEIRKEFEEIPKGNSKAELIFGETF
jgi:hypothetical protein